MDNSQIAIQIIIGLTSIIGTYLTVKYKPRLINKIKNAPEPDRSHFLFDGYEKLIKELQRDLEKSRHNAQKQSETIGHMQEKVNTLERNLYVAHEENKRLVRELQAHGGEV
jgi:hypothetical protein